jgi:hypothetical protein
VQLLERLIAAGAADNLATVYNAVAAADDGLLSVLNQARAQDPGLDWINDAMTVTGLALQAISEAMRGIRPKPDVVDEQARVIADFAFRTGHTAGQVAALLAR